MRPEVTIKSSNVAERVNELTSKQMITRLLMYSCLLSILTACSNKEYTDERMTLEQVKYNILDQELTLSISDIPKEIISAEAVNQAGFEIGESGDRVYIYEYKNNETLENDSNMIHNYLYQITLPNSPLIMTSYNVIIVYVKTNKYDYEVENKLLQIL